MRRNVQRVAILGAGTMGSRIAAHLANCGIPSYLLDIVPKELTDQEKKKGLSLTSAEVRNRIAKTGLEATLKSKPPAFYLPENASLITVGNFEDNMKWLEEVDWIIEAVAEDFSIKRNLLERVILHRKEGVVVSTNTSGLSIARLAQGLPEDFRRHWLGTHFFNPPRYMHLLEVISGPDTLHEVVDAVSDFADRRLGKGIVRAKDTPNFIGNRIGVFCLCSILHEIKNLGLTVEDTDQLTGPLIGWPKSAALGTLDLIGLDILANIAKTVQENAAEDPDREVFQLPDFVQKMIARGLLGNKTGAGFYKRITKATGGSDVEVLDFGLLEYRPRHRSELPFEFAMKTKDWSERLRPLIQTDDRFGRFLWKLLSHTFLYSSRLIPEIGDRILDIDRAMKWGFGWEMGPFELWDAVGLAESTARMEKEGFKIPANITRMLSAGHNLLYKESASGKLYFDFLRENYHVVDTPAGVVTLRDAKNSLNVLSCCDTATLLNLGDDIACIEFHTKMNVIGPAIIDFVIDCLEDRSVTYDGLVIANEGAHFSAGLDLKLLLRNIQDKDWAAVEQLIKKFQQMTMAIKYSPKPVIVAPFKLTLGGGCEIALAAPRNCAYAETQIGLVEALVGLVPAAGGIKEMLLRALDSMPLEADPFPAVRQLFDTITMAKISGSADEARRMGFLRKTDSVIINQKRLIAEAKHAALAMVKNHYTPAHLGPRQDIPVVGESGLSALKVVIHNAHRGGFLTNYDTVVASKIANILCGGELAKSAVISEQYLLDLEREAFVSLCGQAHTQARIQHMLETGKPLKN